MSGCCWCGVENLQIGSDQLFCYECGSGDPLVLLHGNGEEHSFFEKQWEYFSPTRRVLAPDSRGHGFSGRGDGDLSLARFAEDLKQLLDEKEIGQTDILGFDDGAYTAMLFALQYPERVRRLVLVGAHLNHDGYKWHMQLAHKIGMMANQGAGGLDDKAARHSLELLKIQMEEPNLTPEQIGAIQAPTLVVAGKKDHIKEAHTKLIAASIPGAKLAILPGDHYLARHEHKVFNKTVAEFFEQTK